jgi:hypothetical protein
MAQLTLTDVAKVKSTEIGALFIEAGNAAPEVAILRARPVPGLAYERSFQAANGGASSGFRGQNTGVTPSAGSYDKEILACGTQTTYMQIDSRVLANAGTRKAELLAAEALGAAAKFRNELGSELIYSAAGANGFPGFIDKWDDSLVVDAQGDTALGCSSAWLVFIGPNGVEFEFGNDGEFTMPDWQEKTLYDAENKPYPGMEAYIQAHPAFSIGDRKSLVRICNLDADHLLTDTLIARALEFFPVAMSSVAQVRILASRKQVFGLQAGRTAVNPTGQPAPIPTESFGYPIIMTDSIVNTEAPLAVS